MVTKVLASWKFMELYSEEGDSEKETDEIVSLQVVKECYERKQGLKWRMRQSVGAAVIGGGYFMWVDEEDLSEEIALIQVLNKIAKGTSEAATQRSNMQAL